MHLILKPEVIFLPRYYSEKLNSKGFLTVKKLQIFCIFRYSDNDHFCLLLLKSVLKSTFSTLSEEKHINNDLININYLKIFWGSP